MKITLESTTKIVEMNGVPARVWEGVTDKGIKVHAYITFVACGINENQDEFQQDLKEQKPPSPEVAAIPLRLFLE